MAETGIHVDAILDLRELLVDRYEKRKDVFIGTDQFWYWEKGNSSACCAPDAMVVFGVPYREARRSFFTWLEEGAIPSFICEFASEKTWRNDVTVKFALFERLGVKEYFVFDPEALYLHPAIQGWRLLSGAYQSIGINPDGSLTSEELQLTLQPEGTKLRLTDGQTGKKVLSRAERLEESVRQVAIKDAEIARLKAQIDALSKKDGA